MDKEFVEDLGEAEKTDSLVRGIIKNKTAHVAQFALGLALIAFGLILLAEIKAWSRLAGSVLFLAGIGLAYYSFSFGAKRK